MNNWIRKIYILSIIVIFFTQISASEIFAQENNEYKYVRHELTKANVATTDDTVKNVILMIGDGMGVAQVYAGYTANGGKLNMTTAPICGFSITYSASAFITDSGAAGTAMATGKKTTNYFIGMTPDSTEVKSVLQLAGEQGLTTGIVTTCNITHATPASFVAHEPNRRNDEEIAADFLDAAIDIFVGGGRKNFEKRKDKRNLSNELRKKNYDVVYDLEDLKKSQSKKIAALLYDKHPPKYSDKRGEMLPEAVEDVIGKLSKNKDGFFLMVEGSQIDWAGHKRNGEYVTEEVLDFDRAVGKVLEFAAKTSNTLVVITADHECGGMTIEDGNFETGKIDADFTSFSHTGVMVPIFAFGAGATDFAGVMQNTQIFEKIVSALRLKK